METKNARPELAELPETLKTALAEIELKNSVTAQDLIMAFGVAVCERLAEMEDNPKGYGILVAIGQDLDDHRRSANLLHGEGDILRQMMFKLLVKIDPKLRAGLGLIDLLDELTK